MIFGLLFLVDGLMQCTAAYVVRYERWRYVFASGVAEILLAIFFFQPYPTHYVGTVPYCLGLFLAFSGLKLLALAYRVRRLASNPALDDNPHPDFMPTRADAPPQTVFDARRTSERADGPPPDAPLAKTGRRAQLPGGGPLHRGRRRERRGVHRPCRDGVARGRVHQPLSGAEPYHSLEHLARCQKRHG